MEIVTNIEKAHAEYTSYLKSDLLERGWTPALIRDYLGKPDSTPHRFGGGYYCLYDCERVHAAEESPGWKQRRERLKRRQSVPPQQIDLLSAIFAVTRSAKRYRDLAQRYYRSGKHGFSQEASWKKAALYALKDKGIAAAFLAGRVSATRIVGDGFVEYHGEGYCFHSTLLPQGVELPQDGSGKALLVVSKPREATEPRLKDAEFTLQSMPCVPETFQRLVSREQQTQEEERARKRGERDRRHADQSDHWQDDFGDMDEWP